MRKLFEFLETRDGPWLALCASVLILIAGAVILVGTLSVFHQAVVSVVG